MPKKKKKKIKVKKIKVKKSIKKIKIKSLPKKSEQINKKPSQYNLEEKIEIKKVKKQPTEKRQYNLKDYVVYPKHGVGKITAVEKATIGQIEIQFYKIFIEKEKTYPQRSDQSTI